MYTVKYTVPAITGNEVHTDTLTDLDQFYARKLNGKLYDIHFHLEENCPMAIVVYQIIEATGDEEYDRTNTSDSWEHGTVVEMSGDDLIVFNGQYYWRDSDFDNPSCNACGYIIPTEYIGHVNFKLNTDGICPSCAKQRK